MTSALMHYATHMFSRQLSLAAARAATLFIACLAATSMSLSGQQLRPILGLVVDKRGDPVAEVLGQRQVSVPHRPGKRRRSGRRYYTWAELLRRAFGVEVLRCPRCGGARRLLAAIQDPDSIELRQSAPRQAGRVGAAGDEAAV